MMKIFALYLKLSLLEKPEWFDAIYAKFGDPIDFHITLIQPRFIDDARITKLEACVADFVANNPISECGSEVLFEHMIAELEADGTTTCMIVPKDKVALVNYQNKLKMALREYVNFVDPATKTYEESFRPHITIGANMSGSDVAAISPIMQTPFLVKGCITGLVLPIVPNTSLSERTKRENLRVFAL